MVLPYEIVVAETVENKNVEFRGNNALMTPPLFWKYPLRGNLRDSFC